MLHLGLVLETFYPPTLEVRVAATCGAAKEIFPYCLHADRAWLAFLANPGTLAFSSKDLLYESTCRFLRILGTLAMAVSLAEKTAPKFHLPDDIVALQASLAIGILLRYMELWIEDPKNLRGLPLFQQQKLPIEKCSYDIERRYLLR